MGSRLRPCYQCQDRYLACSQYCSKPEYLEYLEDKKKLDEYNRKYAEQIKGACETAARARCAKTHRNRKYGYSDSPIKLPRKGGQNDY